MKYTYGTSETAARRLEEIANFFNPLAIKFIRNYSEGLFNVALDLGCGPGFTTDMLSNATACPQVYGIDKSSSFLKLAAARYENCTFVEHDVTKTPFPLKADVMYARFLLSHLRTVVELVNRWLPELTDGGIVFIEELEDITTESDVFRKYLKINDGLIASQGASLYIGTILAGASYNADVLRNECLTIPVANSQAAGWFLPNTVTIWKEEQYVLDATSQEEREEISRELLRIKDSNDFHSGITWKMRRLVLKKG
jgi:trans-aconitate 2-methyltransferase